MKEQVAFEKNVFNKTSRTDSECPPLPHPALTLSLSSSPSGHICPHRLWTPTGHFLFFRGSFSSPAHLFISTSRERPVTLPNPPSRSTPRPPCQGKRPAELWDWSKVLHVVGEGWKADLEVGLLIPQNEIASRKRGWREGQRAAQVASLVLVSPRVPWKGKKVQSWRRGGRARQGWPVLNVSLTSR